jgi:hypothetical protein
MEARCIPVNVASEGVMENWECEYGVLRQYFTGKSQFCDLKVYSLLKLALVENRSPQ